MNFRLTTNTLIRSAATRQASRIERACARAFVAGLLAFTLGSPAFALAPDATPHRDEPVHAAPSLPDLEAVLRGAAAVEGDETKPTLMERISERLRRIPLRPVMIGEEPRTPDDPEPGLGLTIFIRF